MFAGCRRCYRGFPFANRIAEQHGWALQRYTFRLLMDLDRWLESASSRHLNEKAALTVRILPVADSTLEIDTRASAEVRSATYDN